MTDLVDDMVFDEIPINDDIEGIFIDESNVFDHDDSLTMIKNLLLILLAEPTLLLMQKFTMILTM